jgi:hypothetical protein
MKMAASKNMKAIANTVLEIKPSTIKTVVVLALLFNPLSRFMRSGAHTKITPKRKSATNIISRPINVRRETFGYLFQRVATKTMHPAIATSDGS